MGPDVCLSTVLLECSCSPGANIFVWDRIIELSGKEGSVFYSVLVARESLSMKRLFFFFKKKPKKEMHIFFPLNYFSRKSTAHVKPCLPFWASSHQTSSLPKYCLHFMPYVCRWYNLVNLESLNEREHETYLLRVAWFTHYGYQCYSREQYFS